MPVEYASKRIWFWFHTHVIEDFKSGLVKEEYLRNYGLRLLEIYDDIRGIEWGWMAVS